MRPRSLRQSRWPRALAVVATVSLLVVVILLVLVLRVGNWLVVADPLVPARAIAVLNGEYPFRAVEAASLYHEGWAAEVWVARTTAPDQEAALVRLGIATRGEEDLSRTVLERRGVPSPAIHLLQGGVRNTAEEVRVIARRLREVGGDRVILVTSRPHSRRVRATWRALVGTTPEAVVRYAVTSPFNGDRWWESTRDALAVSREVFGLLNVWAGFPVPAARASSGSADP